MKYKPLLSTNQVVAILVFVILMQLFVVAVNAQERAAFANPVAFDRVCDNASSVVRAAIEAVCTQAQVDAIEAAVNPRPSDEEKADLLRHAEELLRRAEADAIADDVATERERVAPVEAEPVVEPDR